MVKAEDLARAGFKYLGRSYKEMDCQKFVEKCLSDCGCKKDLAGSNAWYRECLNHGTVMTPEECIKKLGCVPKGAIRQSAVKPKKGVVQWFTGLYRSSHSVRGRYSESC